MCAGTGCVRSFWSRYYIDYECNGYQEQWDFEHWGIAYWSMTPEMAAYLREHP